jgi:hypothetical protein
MSIRRRPAGAHGHGAARVAEVDTHTGRAEPDPCAAALHGHAMADCPDAAGPASRRSLAAMDVEAEPMVFRLPACALVRHLDLRPECADAVYVELLSERRLARAWLARDAGAGRLREALAAAGAAARRANATGGAPPDPSAR